VENWFIKDEKEPLAEEISKQNVRSATYFLFDACSKIQDKRDKLREELLSKEKP
jgi:hypothetical protein